MKNNGLIIGYDKDYVNEKSTLVVMQRDNDKIYILNLFEDKEADNLYSKLIGNNK